MLLTSRVSRRASLSLVAGLIAAAAPTVSAGAAEPARADTASSVVVHGDGGYIAGTKTRIWRDGAGVVTPSGSAESGQVTVAVSGGPSGSAFTFSFRAPTGQALTTGHYDAPHSEPSSDAPGLHVSGDGRICGDSGSFDVVEMSPDLSTLWVTYEHHCDGAPQADFGEIRINLPRATDVSFLASRVNWPAKAVGGTSLSLPVTVLSTSASSTRLSAPRVSGGDFELRSSTCGATLGAGAACVVNVAFTPRDAGALSGTLTLTVGEIERDVPLSGTGIGGQSLWHMVSDKGEFIGQGKVWDYDVDDSIQASGSGSFAQVNVGPWIAEFQAPNGSPLVPGTYTGATRLSFNEPDEPGLDVGGDGRGCNQLSGRFEVLEAGYDGGGQLDAFRVRFEQFCGSRNQALRGEIAWRATATDEPPYPPAPLPEPRLSVDRTTYRYGQTVRVVVVAPGAAGQAVSVSTLGRDGSRTAVRRGKISSSGRFLTTLRATARTRLVASVIGSGSSGATRYSVTSVVTQRVTGPYRREGSYVAVRPNRGGRLVASVSPRTASGCFVFFISQRVRSRWATGSRTECVSGGTVDKAALGFDGTGLAGLRFRVRSTFHGDGASATAGGTSDWTYLHFVK